MLDQRSESSPSALKLPDRPDVRSARAGDVVKLARPCGTRAWNNPPTRKPLKDLRAREFRAVLGSRCLLPVCVALSATPEAGMALLWRREAPPPELVLDETDHCGIAAPVGLEVIGETAWGQMRFEPRVRRERPAARRALSPAHLRISGIAALAMKVFSDRRRARRRSAA